MTFAITQHLRTVGFMSRRAEKGPTKAELNRFADLVADLRDYIKDSNFHNVDEIIIDLTNFEADWLSTGEGGAELVEEIELDEAQLIQNLGTFVRNLKDLVRKIQENQKLTDDQKKETIITLNKFRRGVVELLDKAYKFNKEEYRWAQELVADLKKNYSNEAFMAKLDEIKKRGAPGLGTYFIMRFQERREAKATVKAKTVETTITDEYYSILKHIKKHGNLKKPDFKKYLSVIIGNSKMFETQVYIAIENQRDILIRALYIELLAIRKDKEDHQNVEKDLANFNVPRLIAEKHFREMDADHTKFMKLIHDQEKALTVVRNDISKVRGLAA